MAKIDLAGKPICITGASAGIGAATAVACADAGMPVLLAARREDRLVEVADGIRERGGKAEVFVVDVADPDACRRMIAAAEDAFGPLYAVFANAGYGVERAMHEITEEELRGIFDVNFFGSMHTVWPAVERFIERRTGHVLFCSSCLARFPLPYYAAYSATKASQHHAGRAMRLELAPYDVHVSTVHPIGTKTEFFDVAGARSGAASLIEHTSDRFMQTPETVAQAVVRCLRKPCAEVWTSRFVRFGMIASALVPTLADLGVRKMVRQRQARDRGATP
ncbi:MAG: SDR family NAD(P)-dependent oxidoreductase [Planctomycetota bacterium]|nr:MAG: SDR family NAD(P)-dependent oxidoreductase [Planctomycetota bacterium]